MIKLPASERERFEALLSGASSKYGLTPREYLRKVWYHEEAAKLGEYVASVLVDELLQILPVHVAIDDDLLPLPR